jgi:hypothetical protein
MQTNNNQLKITIEPWNNLLSIKVICQAVRVIAEVMELKVLMTEKAKWAGLWMSIIQNIKVRLVLVSVVCFVLMMRYQTKFKVTKKKCDELHKIPKISTIKKYKQWKTF